jgi:HSP20 family protein
MPNFGKANNRSYEIERRRYFMAEADDKKKQQTQPTEKQDEQQSSRSSGEMMATGPQMGGPTRRGAFLPSMFSLSPRDFFRMGPFEMMRRFTDEMDRVFENFGLMRGFGSGQTAIWSPDVEVFERDNSLVVRADLPGMTRDDVKVEMTDEGLIIKGERKHEHEERSEGFYRSERGYGQFYRLIPLPEDVNIDQVRAQFENGVLEISIPIPESQRRNIPIGGAAETGGEEATQTAGGQTQTAKGGTGKK